jgi:ABC-type sugar transport system ATPase subunit
MDAPPLLRVRGLSKSFPGVRALDDVSLEVRVGTVHALMGENGAGKSTLANILAGLDRPDAGTVELDGRPVVFRNPHDALRLGIAMIHQELMPFPGMTVEENVLIGREPVRGWGGWIDRRAMRAKAERLLGRVGCRVPPGETMGSLRVAEMQAVEIARALAADARLILMDEPTSALSAREAEALLRVVDDLRRRGAAVVYVSHKLDEVFRMADAVSVLRDGRHVGTHATRELTPDRLIALMVGRSLDLSTRRVPADRGAVALEARGLSLRGRFRDVSLAVRRGEVLGIAGLMGAGRTSLLHALYGLEPADAGEIRIGGQPAAIRTPADALALGVALVGEDRGRLGLVPGLPVRYNITLATLRRWCRGPFVDPARECETADGQIRALGVKVAHRDVPVSTLSGGNQQKVVIARALLAEPDVLLLDEPTRGIDVAAKAEVHAIVDGLARRGKAVIVASSELPEVLALCDRLLVMREGAMSAELDPRAATQDEILRHAIPA